MRLFIVFVIVLGSGYDVMGGNQPRLNTSSDIPHEEKLFMEKRDIITQNRLLACNKELFPHGFDKNIHKLPRIAFCLSGGGNRALITSLGFMQGAEKIGLLDCVSYASFLSGSSWFYLSFLLKNMSHNMSLHNYRDFLQPRLAQPFKRDPRKFFGEIRTVKKTRGSATISDGFGRIIYDYLLDESVSQHASFKDIRNHLVSSGQNMPFPLFTAIIKNTTPYQWLEVNPFCTGSDELGGYIPTDYFGSVFTHGSCTKIFPELSLASFMGIFGSAYCLNISEFTTALKTRFLPQLQPAQQAEPTPLSQSEKNPSKFRSYWGTGVKLLPNPIESNSTFNNFLQGSKLNPVHTSHIVVADAGIDFNVPTPPLFKKQRNIDLIIICDASYKHGAAHDNFTHIKKAQKHAEQLGIKFPKLSNPTYITDTILLFEDQDPTIPTIIYFRSSVTASTLKFSYTAPEFNNICNTAQNTLIAAQHGIFEAITRKTRMLNGLARA